MTVGDTLIAFGLLAIVVVLTCEACWRAKVPNLRGAKQAGRRPKGETKRSKFHVAATARGPDNK